MRTRPIFTISVMLMVGMAAMACGGGAAPSAEENRAGVPPEILGEVLLVELQEGGSPPRFVPSVIEAKRGAAIKFRFSSLDGQAHTFTVLQTEINLEIAGGETKETEAVTFNQAGTVFFFCRFHRGVGSSGSIKVTN